MKARSFARSWRASTRLSQARTHKTWWVMVCVPQQCGRFIVYSGWPVNMRCFAASGSSCQLATHHEASAAARHSAASAQSCRTQQGELYDAHQQAAKASASLLLDGLRLG